MFHICVAGAGAWGTTMANLVAARAHVILWAHGEDTIRMLRDTRENSIYLPGIRLHDDIEPACDLLQAWNAADAVILAIPTQKLRSVLAPLIIDRGKRLPVLSLSKGLECDTHMRISQIVCDDLNLVDREYFAALSGPNFAPEIARGMPAATVIASRSSHISAYFQQLVSGETLRAYTSSDLAGVELGGAVKNVYALAAGISDGLGFGDSTKASLIMRSLHELTGVGQALGADPLTLNGLAGAGDLIATSFSKLSRNRQAGEAIGRGMVPAEIQSRQRTVIEGLPTLDALAKLAEQCNIDLPIVRQLRGIVTGAITPAVGLKRLMEREARSEF